MVNESTPALDVPPPDDSQVAITTRPEPADISPLPPAPDTQSDSPAATKSPTASPTPLEGSLAVRVLDDRGSPIAGLQVQIVRKNGNEVAMLSAGRTNLNGELPTVEGLAVGTRFDVLIKKDNGEYKFAASGTILAASAHCGNLCIPRTRFEFSTYSHRGQPGVHEERRREITKQQPTRSNDKPNLAAGGAPNLTRTLERDATGRPVSLVKYGLPNMWGIVSAAPADQPGIPDSRKVSELIEFAMEQVKWKHPRSLTSATIIQQMKSGIYKPEKRTGENPGMGYTQSLGLCTKYVKIALWRCGFVKSDGDFAPGTSLARELGPALERAGFSNVTKKIPDARWAAPGDIIVYERLGDPNAAGHVDIRSYDGYISDFYENYLPVTGFRVTGIYRKYYDPTPTARTKSFLKIIRSREAETVFLAQGDDAAYKAMPLSARMGLVFSDFSKHPFLEESKAPSTASGAYGITLASWRRTVDRKVNQKPWVPVEDEGPLFSPKVQDRIALALMELHPGVGFGRNGGRTALGVLRNGDIEEATRLLATVKPYQWPSLPGGTQSKYSLTQMKADYEKYLTEYSR